MDLTGIWPPLPIIIISDYFMPEDIGFDAAIVDPNRACEIDLPYPPWSPIGLSDAGAISGAATSQAWLC
jgi:hypothetical protein